MNTIDELNT